MTVSSFPGFPCISLSILVSLESASFRGNRFSIAEHQERYREDCQRIFEVQNKVLASDEVLSSDEAESSSDDDEAEEEEEDLDEMGRNIEKMLSNKKTNNQFLMEREEVERQKLHKDMMSLKTDGEDRGKIGAGANLSQVLRITRTFRNQQGREFTRTELVRRSMVIETYVKVRNTKDDTFIRQFASMDVQAPRPPPPLSGSTSSRKRGKGSPAQIFEGQAPRHHKKKTV